MKIMSENYYSQETNKEYLSVSQYKDFVGTLGRPGCESKALAKLNGIWKQKSTVALLVGSYVDAYFEGTLDIFKEQHSEIFTKAGALKAEYKQAEKIIDRIKRDKLFMKYMSGEKQVIMTAELFGAKWKIKMDSYHMNICIVDLKVMKSLREVFYIKSCKSYINFVSYYGYDIQGAVYQEIVRRNTGKRLPFYIAAVSKETEPDIEIIQLEQELLDKALEEIKRNVSNILALKVGKIEPITCGNCEYCRSNKVLKSPIWSEELLGEL